MKQFCISIVFFFITQKMIAQPWVPLASNEQTSQSLILTNASTFFTQVSADGIPYVSYIDDIPGASNIGDFKVHARRFNNAAGQWEFAGNAISPAFPASDDFPVALDGNTPYVAYSEPFNPANFRNKLSVRRLNNVTGNWDIVGQQGLSGTEATSSVMAADNGKIYIAYPDSALNNKVTIKRFDNANAANGWQTVGPAGFSNGFVLGFKIAIDNGVPYVSYLDFGDNLTHVKIFNGTDWEDVGANNPTNGELAVIQSLQFNSQHMPFIVFVDAATNAGVVRNLDIATNTWVTTGGQPFATGLDFAASLSFVQDIPFVAFSKKDNNNITQVNVKRFNAATNSWEDVGTQPVTASPFSVNNIALTTGPGNKLFLVFRNLNLGIYAKTFDANIILPVTLTSFTVHKQNDHTLLQWHTENEEDNRSFEIEHSTDGIVFTKIGEVPAQLPGGNPHDYNFTDTHPVDGVNYYRLKQVDINGRFTYSDTISILFSNNKPSAITFFPNPVKDILHTQFATAGKKEIAIRDAAGRVMKQVTTTASVLDINVAGLTAGTYFISVYGDTINETRPFVKN